MFLVMRKGILEQCFRNFKPVICYLNVVVGEVLLSTADTICGLKGYNVRFRNAQNTNVMI